jgi:hypothetical protein
LGLYPTLLQKLTRDLHHGKPSKHYNETYGVTGSETNLEPSILGQH